MKGDNIVHSMNSNGIEIKRPTKVLEFPEGSLAYYSEIDTREVWASYYGQLRFIPISKEVLEEMLSYYD